MEQQMHRPTYPSVIRIPINGTSLEGELAVPANARGIVIFAHGSGSSRLSPRNTFVAKKLRRHKLATLLIDLLTESEDIDYDNRFNTGLLTERLIAVTDWVTHDKRTKRLNVGYFGASTGAAAAIRAAISAEDTVKAVVSRGGRVDLAHEAAEILRVPTMLIVGQHDYGVCETNEEVFLKLTCSKELAIVPGATHLFEEPGALERVAELAGEWFKNYLGGSS